MRFERVLLLVLTAFVLVAGVGCLFAPGAFAEQAGFASSPSSLTEIRAFYGGLQIGIGIFLVWCLRARHRVASGLFLGGLAVGSAGLGRLLGIAFDGAATSHHLANLGIEVVTVLLVATALWRAGWRLNEAAV